MISSIVGPQSARKQTLTQTGEFYPAMVSTDFGPHAIYRQEMNTQSPSFTCSSADLGPPMTSSAGPESGDLSRCNYNTLHTTTTIVHTQDLYRCIARMRYMIYRGNINTTPSHALHLAK